tara:strand:+ start:2353 stop:3093 length:741 start_codon:yes stop_codon:yes gene_type:complete
MSLGRKTRTVETIMTNDRNEIGYYIESTIDTFIENLITNQYNRKRSLLQYMRVHRIKKSDCRSILDTCVSMRDELDTVLVDKDPDLIEGYSYLTTSKIKKLREFIDSLCSDIKTYSTITRKRKKLTPERMLNKFKYMDELPSGNLKSFDPTRIFDIETFLAYNVKTGDIFYYKTDSKFEIKGTTLLNFNENESYCCRVGRRGLSFIIGLTTGTSGFAEKQLNNIKTKKKQCAGRFNINTILLRIMK